MGLPADNVIPDYRYTYPSERNYYDESTSTLADAAVTDPAKTGADYGIEDPEVTTPVVEPTP